MTASERVVEFAGAPGAGKSTLAAALAGRIGAVAGDALTRRGGDRRVAAARFLARHPRLVATVVLALAAGGAGWPGRALALRRFLRDAALRERARGLPAGAVAVFAEGLVQRVVGLCVQPGRRARTAEAARYARHVPPPAALALVRAPLAVCVTRLAERGAPRRVGSLPAGPLLAFVRDAAEVVEVVSEVLARRGCPVIALDNTGDLEVALAPAVEALGARPIAGPGARR